MNDDILRKNIINLREKRGWSQAELARRINMNNTALNKVEKGTRKLSSSELTELASVFEVSTDYLLGRNYQSKADQVHDATLDEALGTIMSFEGQPVTEHDKKVMKDLLESYLRNKE